MAAVASSVVVRGVGIAGINFPAQVRALSGLRLMAFHRLRRLVTFATASTCRPVWVKGHEGMRKESRRESKGRQWCVRSMRTGREGEGEARAANGDLVGFGESKEQLAVVRSDLVRG